MKVQHLKLRYAIAACSSDSSCLALVQRVELRATCGEYVVLYVAVQASTVLSSI